MNAASPPSPPPDPERIKVMLGLEPHPTCGFVAETYRSATRVPLPAPWDGERPVGSALWFLVTRDAHIRLHRIRSDQQYHHYLGDPLEVLLLHPDGGGEITTVGPDLAAGHRPMLHIPGGTFHVSRLPGDASWALLSSTEWPGVEPPDVEVGDVEALVGRYPEQADDLRAFVATHEPT